MAFDDIIRVYLDFGSNADKVLDSVTSKVDSMGDRISKIGQGFLPFSLGAGAALAGAAKLAIDFDKALQSASRGLDLSEKEVAEFAKSMESLQKELGYQFSSTELARIATEAGKLGVAKNEVDDFAKNVTKLAVAVDKTDKIDELSTNMAKVQTIFKLSVPELEKFGAAMNKLDDASSATADQILTFSQMAGKVGSAFKVNQNVLAAYGTTLVSAGAKAGEAATFMNKFLTVLAAPTNSSKPAQASIEKLGYSVSNLAQRFDKDAKGTMEDFIKRLQTLDSVTQKDVMGRIFGLEHIDNAALLVAQTDNLQKYLKMAGDSEGNIAKLNNEFEKMSQNSFEGQYRTFINLTGELGKQIGQVILPGLNSIMTGIQPILEGLVNITQTYPGVSKIIAIGLGIVTAFAPVMITLGAVVNGLTAVTSAGSLLLGFLGISLAPIGLFVVGIAAIAAGAYLIIKNWNPISGFFNNLWKSANTSMSNFYSSSIRSLSSLTANMSAMFSSARISLRDYVNSIGNSFLGFTSQIKSIFSNLIANAKYYGQMLIYGFIQGVQSYASNLISSVSGLMQTVRGYLPSSPSKYGALSDLDKTGMAFTNTFLEGIERSPLNSFLNSAFTSPQTNNPGLMIPASGGANSTTIEVNYSPIINGSRVDAEIILGLLRNDQRGLQNVINDAASKLNRRYYS